MREREREREGERERSDKSIEGYLPPGEGSWLCAAAIKTAMLMLCRRLNIGPSSKEDRGNSRKDSALILPFLLLIHSPKSLNSKPPNRLN